MSDSVNAQKGAENLNPPTPNGEQVQSQEPEGKPIMFFKSVHANQCTRQAPKVNPLDNLLQNLLWEQAEPAWRAVSRLHTDKIKIVVSTPCRVGPNKFWKMMQQANCQEAAGALAEGSENEQGN